MEQFRIFGYGSRLWCWGLTLSGISLLWFSAITSASTCIHSYIELVPVNNPLLCDLRSFCLNERGRIKLAISQDSSLRVWAYQFSMQIS